jgi:ribosomal protein S18 acetylase RimI-like enzyme
MASLNARTMTLRDYQPSDRAACLAVFDSNVGKSFLTSERPDFEAFLDTLPGPYLVLEENDVIIACGGYGPNEDAPDTADLCWGMVRLDLQRTGLGKLLVDARLDRIRADRAFSFVFLKTSQETAPFYERFGFVTQQVVENGIAEGMHRYDMRLTLAPQTAN